MQKPTVIFIAILIGLTTSLTKLYGAQEAIALKLLGTIVEPDPAKSLAVVLNLKSQKQSVCKIMDEVLGYQVVKILRGRIILLKNNKLSALDFPLGNVVQPIIVISSQDRIINRSALSQKIPDISTAIKLGLPIPHIENGRFSGFKLTRLKDRALAQLAGLKEGDIITSVNGQNLDSLPKSLEVYHKTTHQEKVTVQIKRGNETKDLVYYLN